ncbi:hypothetical protein T484DRAFT_1769421 [Baffinella frigidus]|nr:hypothetical protein T484DRAFT_1769421 [Cryptophyta sp. CCMP2293]
MLAVGLDSGRVMLVDEATGGRSAKEGKSNVCSRCHEFCGVNLRFACGRCVALCITCTSSFAKLLQTRLEETARPNALSKAGLRPPLSPPARSRNMNMEPFPRIRRATSPISPSHHQFSAGSLSPLRRDWARPSLSSRLSSQLHSLAAIAIQPGSPRSGRAGEEAGPGISPSISPRARKNGTLDPLQARRRPLVVRADVQHVQLSPMRRGGRRISLLDPEEYVQLGSVLRRLGDKVQAKHEIVGGRVAL